MYVYLTNGAYAALLGCVGVRGMKERCKENQLESTSTIVRILCKVPIEGSFGALDPRGLGVSEEKASLNTGTPARRTRGGEMEEAVG